MTSLPALTERTPREPPDGGRVVANHPLNLALRFALELALLAALGVYGWQAGTGAWRWLLALLLPLAAAAVWGIFRVPNDGGAPVVQVPGIVRLLIEIALFALAVWALAAAGHPRWALALGGVTLLHYALSYDRVLWLLRGAPAGNVAKQRSSEVAK
jgi:hypothetical protein